LTREEIEKAAIQAGFQPLALQDQSRALFTRGKNFLNVHMDGKWAFYSEVRDSKKPDQYGSDFQSLLLFLST
jgi:hypothetical protein